MKGLKDHRYLLAVIIAAFAFYLLFAHNRLYGEINGSFISYGFAMKEAYSQGSMPFWSTELSGGYPLYANPEMPMFGLLNLMLLMLPDVILAFSITTLIHILIAGTGAALLAKEFTGNRHAAVVSGIAYMLIGSFAFSVFTGTMPFLYPLAFLPLILLFAYRATKENHFRNAAITAALLAYQIISGGTMHFLWTLLGVWLLLGSCTIFSLIKTRSRNEIIKLALVGVVIIAFTFGFSAVKLLPALEFNKLTDRAEGVSYDDFVWKHTQIRLPEIPAAMFGPNITMMRTGVIVFLLAAAGIILSFRKKYVMALALIALTALLIEIGTFLTQILYHLPGYGQTRQINNVLGLFSISAAVLAGIGWDKIVRKLKSRHFAATAAVILLIVAELFFFGYDIQKQPWEKNFGEQLQENLLLQNISNSEGRLHLYGEDFVGLSLAKYAIPLGIRMMDWTTGNVWFNDYATFTAIAGQQNSVKLWGMANVKHIAAKQELQLPGLQFIGDFGKCASCDLTAPYLYENTEALPEAFIAKSAALVAGDEGKNGYAMALNSNFNSKTTAIVKSEKLPQNLGDYGMILLASGGLSDEEVSSLAKYAARGGVIEPQINLGTTQVNSERVFSWLASQNEAITEAGITTFAPTKVEIEATETGLLILGEKFYKFKEWEAKINGKKSEKLNANFIATGLFVNKGDKVSFDYKPKAFYTGFAITLAAIITAFIIPLLLRKAKSGKRGSQVHTGELTS